MPLEIIAAAKAIAPEVIKDGVAKLLEHYWERKKAEAFDELMDAVRSGEIAEVDAALENDLAHALWKYFCAARDGAARRNLRLIAKAIVGLLKEGRLFADDLDRYTPVLGRLTERQILVMVELNKIFEESAALGEVLPISSITVRGTILQNIQERTGYGADQVESALWELTSMGLVLPQAALDGGQFFKPSELSAEIIKRAALA